MCLNVCSLFCSDICTLVSWCQQRNITNPSWEYPPSKADVGNIAFWRANVGSWCTHSVMLESPGQRNNCVCSPCSWCSTKCVSWKNYLEGGVLGQMSLTTNLELCFDFASILTFMTPTWLAAMTFKSLVELIDGSLTSSVPMGAVLDTMVAKWF